MDLGLFAEVGLGGGVALEGGLVVAGLVGGDAGVDVAVGGREGLGQPPGGDQPEEGLAACCDHGFCLLRSPSASERASSSSAGTTRKG
jgi:hypothetical protein